MAETPGGASPQGSPRVSLLIDQLKQLVAERRRLEARARGARLATYRAELARLSAKIARLQRQLAIAVRHDLSDNESLLRARQ